MVQVQSTWFPAQPAALRAEHLQGQGFEPSESNAANLPLTLAGIAYVLPVMRNQNLAMLGSIGLRIKVSSRKEIFSTEYAVAIRGLRRFELQVRSRRTKSSCMASLSLVKT